MTESFGMMDGAYFVGKNEILKWVNNTYKLNLTKIEQACTGALYCQIIDSIHPNKVKMHKVNWKAKLEHEFIPNYKILQQAFDECKISKNIEVEKLTKGKYQDNLEFLQWMKRYTDERNIQFDYDALGRRGNHELEVCNEIVNNGNMSRKREQRDNSKPRSKSPSVNLGSKSNIGNIGNMGNMGNETRVKGVNSKTNEHTGNISKNYLLIHLLIQFIYLLVPISSNNSIKGESKNKSSIHIHIQTNSPSTSSIRNPFLKINEEPKIREEEEEEKKKNITEEMTDILRQHYQEKLDITNDEVSKLKLEVATLKMSISEIGNQRDFYFSKLRDVEMLTGKNTNLDREGLINMIKTVLFSEKETELIFDESGAVNVKNH